ncbi:MAG: hypothetical protein IBX52_08770 [Bacterioplanes sp.]|nr:hypothetical protein [Bacterioplanes sp.]
MRILMLLACLMILPNLMANEIDRLLPLTVIAIHQLDDESNASFDFITAERVHQCGGKASGRFRVYSRHSAVAERRFQITLHALNGVGKLQIRAIGCEGNAMKVDQVGMIR